MADTIEVVIETPRGSVIKYDYDPLTKFFKAKKVLPAGMVFPFDFGFIPGTKGQDGDPLDAIVISEFSNFPGSLLECRIIGCMKAKQTDEQDKSKKIRNDRYVAVPIHSLLFEQVSSVSELPPRIFTELEDFFIQYNKVEHKSFRVTGKSGPKRSAKMIKEATN